MLRASQSSNKYQFHSLWFDPIWAQTHDLPHNSVNLHMTDQKVMHISGPKQQKMDSGEDYV
jgi:hypothetical protein